jgi:hypothetical protein
MTSIHSGKTALAAWPFLRCVASQRENALTIEQCFQTSMNGSGLEWNTVRACTTTEYDCVVDAGANASPKQQLTNHLSVFVDGHALDNPDADLLTAVCKAYAGSVPNSCQ